MILRRTVAVSKDLQVQKLAHQVAREIFMADNPDEALDIIETVNPELIIFERCSNHTDAGQFLSMTDKKSINIPVVVIGNENDDSESLKNLKKQGAYDYLKGKKDDKRLKQISTQIKNEKTVIDGQKYNNRFFLNTSAAEAGIVGQSEAIRNTLRMIKLIAESQCNPILILGETGTGKELAAKAVHNIKHPNEKFVAVNCAALTANLLESELFGHSKGSFTGAQYEKTGLLELAGEGTIFLDEISEMPMDLQAKLLRVLQEKTFRKVGGIKDITCKAAIIASSNHNLHNQTQHNLFRRDLYYRLNICPVCIAPLRDPARKEDVGLLAEYFLQTSNICPQKCGKIASITKLAIEALQKHCWPGNVRELRNIIDRAIIMETVDKIGLSSIVFDSSIGTQTMHTSTMGGSNDFSLEKAERELIGRALQETGWQKTRAAALLGITRATLYAKVKQYSIKKNANQQNYCKNKTLLPAQPQNVTAI